MVYTWIIIQKRKDTTYIDFRRIVWYITVRYLDKFLDKKTIKLRRSLMRKLALLLLCLASCFVTVFAQGGGGGGGPVPTANFRITGVQMDQPRAFVVGDTTTQFANATAYDYDTGEPIPITGFVGFAPMSSDSLTVRINWFNPFTGEVNYSVLQPGTARIFFVSDQPDSRGKLPPDWRGVFITGIQPAEHDSYARSEVLVYPESYRRAQHPISGILSHCLIKPTVRSYNSR